ncbi:MAG: dTDP-4-dehydrorhamnose 3,5-epimerase family protein [Rhodoferax sp.]|jgi:dTDP-4-dehydrorhamnose 3,5-epimerase|uniref:dTDP-4-dehydrorhamnose 3,5-epimerase family protein n=1 Tax=Rhodoferax sp. TaxID=50421 RepID=UPI001B72A59E|nr:dTDP-4-dehydrorhamnose 3,5-epimerase family protein [Rhodoferax sp.]MBP8285363.1 dTDP-4-dehydrorhamnose 3,5-epimerase family protein [Rhodoferax sp.]MBP9147929.1 dTDP-4-dehydrorhamnose 3,5-epimerase family protein [Rhodoferax sp.]MBP9735010.1 dTDP-4-dehydrorhamnose 3,5-epimerase family protein [Rhodoferax sp.]
MSAQLSIHPTPLVGLSVVRRHAQADARGSFTRLFCSETLSAAGWPGAVVQVNHSLSRQLGTVRGLHFQRPPHQEWKLVTCVQGLVWDVAVDVRTHSPTYLKWHAETLSADNGLAMLIPAGFAHGFQTLSNNVELVYCHSHAYYPAAEGGLNPNDPTAAVQWPLPVSQWSERDRQLLTVDQGFAGVEL